MTEVITGLNEVWGLAAVDNRIFWLEYISNSSSTITIIRSAHIDGSNLVDIITQGSPLGIAINPNSRKLYWRDSDLKMIRSSDLDGRNIVNIVSTNDGSFGIALDIIGGKIYWTDIWPDTNGSNWPVIRQSNLDGSGASNFTNPGASYGYGPNLAVDHKGGRLFSTGSPSNTCEHSLSTGVARCTSGTWSGDLSWIAIDEQQRYSFITIQNTIYKLDLELPFTSPYAGLTYPNWRWSTIRGIAVAPDSLPPPGLLNTPEQPVYGAPPPVVTVPPEKSKNLVLLVHGWNSDPSAWAIPMKESIKKQLPSYNGQEGCNEGQTIEDASTSWQICTYDWSSSAKLPLTPWEAYVNALNVGKNLAAKIVYEQRSYDFIHFIAHSAGSQVAETAATWLRIFIDTHNAQPGDPLTKPVIHTTFLDAYDPLGSGSNYGASSDWAEQYVDMRRVGDLLLDDTDIMLSGAYNFDITALDPNGNNISGTAAHAWPYEWYEKTIGNPANSDYGFSLSLESGRDQLPSQFLKGGRCVFLSSISTECSESGVLRTIASVRVIVDDVFDIPKAILDATISPTGSVIFLPSKVIKLITGSPAWASLPIEVTEPIDVLSFDYTYLRQAEGLLSVFIDDQLVFRSDQRVEPAGLNHSDNVPIGAITSGKHTLSFRLDAFNGTQSEIDLSHIQLGKMEVSAPVTNSLTVTKVGSGNGTVTSNPPGIDCGETCSASFDSGASVSLTATPAAGSTFAGWSPASCGNPFTLTADTTCTATFNLANRPPVANAGPDQTVESTGPNGASVTLDGSGSSDPDNDPLTFAWTGPFGTASGPNPTVALPLGTHTITLTVDDGHGGTATDTVVVTVRDTTPPVLSLPADPLTVEAGGSSSGVVVTYTASAKDLVDGAISPDCTPASGTTFPIGTTTVGCTATDKAENTASGNFKITVVGTTPPSSTPFSAFSVNPLRINQRLKTFFLLSSFTLGSGNNGIDPTKEPVTLTVAGFTATIPARSFRKGSGPFGVYAFAGKIDGVSIEMLITPLRNNRFGFQAAAYGADPSVANNPVTVELAIGNDNGTTSVKPVIIK